MSSPLSFQQRKSAAQFHALDFDGNGYLERGDYEAIVARLLEEFAVDADGPTARNLRHRYLDLFERMLARMDTDADGRVSLEEFLTSVGSSVTKSGGRAMRPVAHAVFTTADRDQDDHLSAEEFRRLLTVLKAPMDQDAIEQVCDSGGRLYREAFVEVIQDYYGSSDPQAPGSRLFGPVSG